eukprot:748093-Prymnesium_polylepis.1
MEEEGALEARRRLEATRSAAITAGACAGAMDCSRERGESWCGIWQIVTQRLCHTGGGFIQLCDTTQRAHPKRTNVERRRDGDGGPDGGGREDHGRAGGAPPRTRHLQGRGHQARLEGGA